MAIFEYSTVYNATRIKLKAQLLPRDPRNAARRYQQTQRRLYVDAGRSATGSMMRAKSSDRESRQTGRAAGAASVTAFDSRLEQRAAATLVPFLPSGAFVPVPFAAGQVGSLQMPPHTAYSSSQQQYSLSMNSQPQHAPPCACVECVGVADGAQTLIRPVATYGVRTPAPIAQQSALALHTPSAFSGPSRASQPVATDRSVMLQSFEVAGAADDCEQCARVPMLLQQEGAAAAASTSDRSRRPLVRKPLAIYSQASYV